MKNYIIGLYCDNSRFKEIVIDMINYIFNKGVTAANYTDYLETKTAESNSIIYRRISPIDKYISIFCELYNVKRKLITNESIYNDYFCLNTKTFINGNRVVNDLRNSDIYKIIGDVSLENNTLAEIYDKYSKQDKLVCITVYKLFDYMRKQLNNLENDIIKNSFIKDAIDVAELKHVCIVTDVVSDDLMKRIGSINNNFLYGECAIIKCNDLQINTNVNYNHTIIDLQNKSLMRCFYIILNYCQTLNTK